MINARRVAQIVTRVFDFEQLAPPYKSDLAARLGDSGFRAAFGPEVSRKADTLRKLGNRAVHETRPITATSALAVLRQLPDLLRWACGRCQSSGRWSSAAIAAQEGLLAQVADDAIDSDHQLR